MRNLNLDQLQTLVRVVELGNFSAAARSLNLTQPAVSLQVRELEERLGVRLVDRLGKRAFATAAGLDLIERARRLHGEAKEAEEAMRRHREGRTGRVRVTANDIFCSYLLPDAIKAFRAKRPNAEIVATIASSGNATEQAIDNRVDLAVVTMPVADRALDVRPFRREPIVAILPPSETRAPARLAATDLARHPMILDLPSAKYSRLVRAWFEAGGVEPKPVMETSAYESVKQLVRAGLAVSILPRVAVASSHYRDLVVRPLKPALTWDLALVQRRDKQPDPVVADMRDALLALRRR